MFNKTKLCVTISFVVFFLFFLGQLVAQESTQKLPLFVASDTFHPKRFWIGTGVVTASYTGASIGLWNAWYKNYELSKFHLFDDRGEWENMDKVGHLLTAYTYTRWAYSSAKWTGLSDKKAMWTAIGIGSGLQATIEIMDGFSEKWGFSGADIGMNTLGVATFVAQELIWDEQRITIKISAYRRPYPTDIIYSIDGQHTTTLAARGDALYGSSYAEIFLKDYNSQVDWMSINVHSFLRNENSKFPKWLNVSLGYGADNMFAGFGYEFTGPDGGEFVLDPNIYPRYHQYFLSFDVDLTKIKTKHRSLNALLNALNFVKIPAPTLELNSLGKVKFHPIYW